jgi:transposase-like protein
LTPPRHSNDLWHAPAWFASKATIARSRANTAALDALLEETCASIEVRQIKSLNNRIEQNHHSVKRIVQPMLGFKSFRSARIALQGISN